MASIVIRHSAFRHGISRDRILYVIEHCQLPYDDPDGIDVVWFLGDDWNGVELEVGAVELADDGDDLMVIHAMPLREKYRAPYEAALRARAVP